MSKLKTGDTGQVLGGKDRGKRGKVLHVYPQQQEALVERLNLAKHFDRRTRADQPGGIIEREVPLAIAKLAVVCPRCSKPTRVGFRVEQGQAAAGAKQRLCRQCHEAFS